MLRLNADTDDPFKKFGFTYKYNARLYETPWGFVFRYINTAVKSDPGRKVVACESGRYGTFLIDAGYVGKKIKYVLGYANRYTKKEKKAEREREEQLFKGGVITFRFKSRLYPMAPATRMIIRNIKHNRKTGCADLKREYCKPCLSFRQSSPEKIQYVFQCGDGIRGSGDVVMTKILSNIRSKGPVKINLVNFSHAIKQLYSDGRIVANDLFKINDHKIVIDFKNRILLHSRNGYKEIFELDTFCPKLLYYSYKIDLGPMEFKNKIIALEYEFTPLSIELFGDSSPTVDNCSYPESDAESCRKRIKEEKDVDAMFHLGCCYYDGVGGVAKDYYEAMRWFKKAAGKDHVTAFYRIGMCHYYGHGVDKDLKIAGKWFGKGARYLYSNAIVMKAYCLALESKNNPLNNPLSSDFSELISEATWQGNANAYFLNESKGMKRKPGGAFINPGFKASGGFAEAAGRNHPKGMYYLGLQNKLPLSRRVYLLEKAAASGFSPACAKLGDLYLKRQSSGKAFSWYEKAASGGDINGKYGMGACYFLGCGVSTDRKKAGELFQVAGEAGLPRAIIALSLLEDGGEKTESSSKLFFRGDDVSAVKLWYESDLPRDKFRTAIALKYGIGIKADPNKALALLLESQNTSPYALFEIAKSYDQGIGVPKNYSRALAMYNRVVDSGLSVAILAAGKFFARNNNRAKAVKYYALAAKSGNPEAAYRFGMMYLKGSGVRQNQRLAFRAFNVAAAKGYIDAMYMIGDCYYKGIGTGKNPGKAAMIWREYEIKRLQHENNDPDTPWQGYLPSHPVYENTPKQPPPGKLDKSVDPELIRKYLNKY